MKVILKEKSKYLLRFDSGDEVIEGVKNFCIENNVKSGSFTAIGAAHEAVLSYYDLGAKKYSDHEIKERLEITSLVGNVAQLDDKTIVHAHATLADKNLNIKGGHAKKLIVSATCEIVLETFDNDIKRKYSNNTGLNLLQ